jgi:ketosteroid isomerase-like protein
VGVQLDGGHAVDVEAEVMAVGAAWDAALVANDANAFAGFVTDDWVYVGPTGPVPRSDVVGWIASGTLVHHTMHTIGTPRVAVHDEVVIVTARRASTGAWEGRPYAADEWISEVFVRQDGTWRSAMSQKCPAE